MFYVFAASAISLLGAWIGFWLLSATTVSGSNTIGYLALAHIIYGIGSGVLSLYVPLKGVKANLSLVKWFAISFLAILAVCLSIMGLMFMNFIWLVVYALVLYVQVALIRRIVPPNKSSQPTPYRGG